MSLWCAPVGHLAAGVFVEPAEFVRRPAVDHPVPPLAFHVVGQRGRPEPEVPVQAFGHIDLGDGVAGGVAADARLDLLDLADAAVPHQLAGEAEFAAELAALLAADLENPAGVLGDLDHGLALVDGEGERLLAVDVLLFAHGLDGDEGVPVVGHGDGDGVDVRVVQQLSEVLVALGVEAVLFHDGQAAVEVGLSTSQAATYSTPLWLLGGAVDGELAAGRAADADGAHHDLLTGLVRRLRIVGGKSLARTRPAGRRRTSAPPPTAA